MDIELLKTHWNERFLNTVHQLDKLKQIPSAATAFNANIDAVFKITGSRLQELIEDNNLSVDVLQNITKTGFTKPQDTILGIFKCFSQGIAEEWVTEDVNVYNWISKHLGYQYLQMGGQGGIIANTLALLGVQKVIAHTNSHPQLQAQQFLNLDNLLAFDDDGQLKKASQISRATDEPLIHWIIEFDKNDKLTVGQKTFVCPKSNRFIVTYDPLNMNLVMNKHFISYLNHNSVSYLLLSGFHPLLSNKNGVDLIKSAVPILKKWKENNKDMIVHLEIASTQDKIIRQAIVEHIAPLAHSAGLNERETIDLLEIFDNKQLYQQVSETTDACHLYDAVLYLKRKLKLPRIQLHMFGLYLTIQDDRFPFSPYQNVLGMISAALVASAKALHGALNSSLDVVKTTDYSVSNTGLKELYLLANKLNKPELLENGFCEIDGNFVSAIPTILIEKPKTLVGMGDTISSVSLLAGR